MNSRTLLAAVAWLGAALTAILVGVVAINLVGASIVGTPGGVRSQSDIERDLAAAPLPAAPPAVPQRPDPDPSDPAAADPDPSDPAATDPDQDASGSGRDSSEPSGSGRDSSGPSAADRYPPRPPATGPSRSTGTDPGTRRPPVRTGLLPVRREFRVNGGLVVAECVVGLARLVSWSPGRGYSIDDVDRGPDDDVSVQFDGPDKDVELTVSCIGGVPEGKLDEDD